MPKRTYLSFKFVSCRRFSLGRIVTNKDSTDDNAWVCNSELGICGRPLTDTRVLMPLSREILLPENLDADADLRQSERQRPSQETTLAQKGRDRWEVLLKSALTMSNYDMKGKAVILLNFTGYVEDVGCAVS